MSASKSETTSRTGILSRIVKGAGIALLGALAGAVLRYLLHLLLAKQLGAAQLGMFFLGLAILKISQPLAEAGVPTGVIRYVAYHRGVRDQRRVKGIIVTAIRWASISGSAIGLILILFAPVLASGIFHNPALAPVIRYAGLMVPCSLMVTVLLAATQGFQVMTYKAVVRDLVIPTTHILFVSAVFILGGGLKEALVAYLLGFILSVPLAAFYLNKIFPQLRIKKVAPILQFGTLFRFSWPLFFVGVSGQLVLWTDVIMLGFFRPPVEIGIYSVAQRTALLLTFVIISFNAILSPVISDLFANHRKEELENQFKRVTRWIFSLTLPGFILLVVFGENILNLFGSEFNAGITSLLLLCIGWLVNAAAGPVGQMVVMTGHSRLHLINSSIGVLSNIVLNLLLIPRYGINGAALATAVSWTVANIMALIQVFYLFRIHPYTVEILKPIVAGAAAGAGLYALKHLVMNTTGLLHMLAQAGAFFVFYTGLLIIMKLDTEDRYMLAKIVQRVNEPRRQRKP